MNRLFQSLALWSVCILYGSPVFAQFAPQAGIAGSTAIRADSAAFVAWATGCTVQRGYLDIADPSAGRAISGEDAMGTGKPDNQVVSLGDSGVATLTFPGYIVNGPGPDFAVFENGFGNPVNPEEAFLELAFVEVSSDGINYTRFQPECHIQDTQQIAGAGMFINARQIHNLAGKYKARFGTPFDLDELAGTPGLDVDRITHVRIVDVIGTLDDTYGTKDKDSNRINDPYPTSFDVGTGGFDLDAVGVIHQLPNSVRNISEQPPFRIYPNPVVGSYLHVRSEQGKQLTVRIADVTGRVLHGMVIPDGNISLPFGNYPGGLYYIMLEDASGMKWTECISKY